jgi:hypothetical protein
MAVTRLTVPSTRRRDRLKMSQRSIGGSEQIRPLLPLPHLSCCGPRLVAAQGYYAIALDIARKYLKSLSLYLFIHMGEIQFMS